MSRSQHDRYLEYLERFTYFARGGVVRLTLEQFREVDDEHRRLSSIARRSPAEDEARRALEEVLLRD